MGDFSVAVADADQYVLQIAGTNISLGAGQSGYGDGKWLTIKQKSPSFTSKEGTDGSVARAKTNRRLIEAQLVLLQTAESNDFLSSLHQLDVNQPNGAGIGSFLLKDLQGTTFVKCSQLWIVTFADIELDRDVSMRTWTFEGPWSVFVVGSNLNNVSGLDLDAFYAGREVSVLGDVSHGSELDELMARAY
jgi:hypothetical protein